VTIKSDDLGDTLFIPFEMVVVTVAAAASVMEKGKNVVVVVGDATRLDRAINDVVEASKRKEISRCCHANQIL
jgi:transcription termination factor Rho